MGSQPNLASRSEVVLIYKSPKNFRGPSPNLGCKILDHFSSPSAVDSAYLRNDTSHRQTKMLVSIYNVSPKSLPTFVFFDPETAEIRLLEMNE